MNKIITICGLFPNFKSTSAWKVDTFQGAQGRPRCAEFTKAKVLWTAPYLKSLLLSFQYFKVPGTGK